jgi:IS30 family transposase
MTYRQLTLEERYRIVALRKLGYRPAAIARELGRHRSTITRERARNRTARGPYEAHPADCQAQARRSVSRRNHRVTPAEWAVVVAELQRTDASPEQVAGRLRALGQVRISRETIYTRLREDREAGGNLYLRLRQAHKRRRRRLGRRRSGGPRGRSIHARPARVEARQEIGHWEIDTVMGQGSRDCLLTAVERVTGYVVIGKLATHTAAAFAARAIHLLRTHPHPVRTITADNGTELTSYRQIAAALGTTFYFSDPYSAWQRGSNENTNGLIRQYVRKGTSMAHLTQHDCNRLARRLNRRPRKRLNYDTPEERYAR